jgi:hypothetical protein
LKKSQRSRVGKIMAGEEEILPEVEAVRYSPYPPNRCELKERGEPSGWPKHGADEHEWYQDR